ncbi:hypothetical protein DMH25_18725 [Streptomyces sp. WAC 01325]|nr:hypothetical protein DMH25_18725 [Streptomyces sp. WAC 01325]
MPSPRSAAVATPPDPKSRIEQAPTASFHPVRLFLELPNKRGFPSGPARKFPLSEARRLQLVALTFYEPRAWGGKVRNRGTHHELDVVDVTMDTVVRRRVTML